MGTDLAIDTTLVYAPPKPRRTKWILYCGVLLAATVLASIAHQNAPEALRRCRVYYLQHRLLVAEAAPLTPVYSAKWTTMPQGALIAHTGQDNQTYHQLRALCLPPADKELAGVYSHEIITKSGKKLLVVVRIDASVGSNEFLDPATSLVLAADLVEPGGLWRDPKESIIPGGCAYFFDASLEQMAGTGLVVYAGQSDPADPSTFTIDYDLNGKRHTIYAHFDSHSLLLDRRK